MYFVGINMSQPVQITRRLLFLFFSIFISVLYFGFSISLEFPDMKKMMQATMTMTLGVQVVIRLILYLFNANQTYELHESIKQFYEVCDGFNRKRKNLLVILSKRLKIIFVVIFASHAFCQFFPFCISLFKLAWKGEKVPPIPAFVPGIDRDSIAGFSVNTFLQLFISLMLYQGNPAADCTYLLFVTHLKPCVDMFSCDLSDLEELLLSDEGKKQENLKIIKEKLRNLIEKHLEILNFFEILVKFINKQFFVLITFNIYVICSSGISLLTSDYSIAIGIALLYPIQIFFVCAMGSFVRHQHQRLNDILWQFKWYELPVRHQKSFLYFMLNAQQPMSLDLLFIGVIDMELYTNVRELIYFHKLSLLMN